MNCIYCGKQVMENDRRWHSECWDEEQCKMNDPDLNPSISIGKCAVEGCLRNSKRMFRTFGYNEPLCEKHGKAYSPTSRWDYHPGGLA